MLASKTILLSLLAVIIVTWLLAASITQIQPLSSSPGSSGTSSGGGAGGSSGGAGSGSGLTGLGGSSGLSLPHFNFSLPKFNLNFPNMSRYIPRLNFTLPNLGNMFGSGGTGSSGTGGSSGSGGSGGSGSSGGSGGSGGSSSGGSSGSGGTSQSSSPHPVFPPINQLLLIIIISVVAVSAVVLTISKMSLSRKKSTDEETETDSELLLSTVNPDDGNNYSSIQIGIGAGEAIAPFEGWSSGYDMIKPAIKVDLPLLWSYGSNLGITYDPDASMVASCDLKSKTPGSATITPSKSCNMIKASKGRNVETKFIRGVQYDSDVIDLMHLNILKEADFRQDNLTIREIVEKMAANSRFKDGSEMPLLVEIFERSFYGKMQIGRDQYEQFLYGIFHSVNQPKVIVCKGEGD